MNKECLLRGRGMNPPKFSDKRDLCKKLLDGGKSKFDDDLDGLRDLRDQLAHAATFVDRSEGKTGVAAFVDKFESAKLWIDVLTKVAANPTTTK
jgi:hypothetical protein